MRFSARWVFCDFFSFVVGDLNEFDKFNSAVGLEKYLGKSILFKQFFVTTDLTENTASDAIYSKYRKTAIRASIHHSPAGIIRSPMSESRELCVYVYFFRAMATNLEIEPFSLSLQASNHLKVSFERNYRRRSRQTDSPIFFSSPHSSSPGFEVARPCKYKRARGAFVILRGGI